jgi:hypothetical protein
MLWYCLEYVFKYGSTERTYENDCKSHIYIYKEKDKLIMEFFL